MPSPRRFGVPNPSKAFRGGTAAAVAGTPAGTVYDDSLTETASAADALVAAQVFTEAGFSEAGAAADSDAGLGTWPVALSEAGSGADALASAATWPAAMAEAATAADSASGGNATSDPLTEAGGAADTVAGGLSLAGSVAESGTAVDSPSVALAAGGDAQEAGDAADALASVQGFAESPAEALAAADALAAAGVLGAALAEAGSAADAQDAPQPAVYDDALQEAATALDSLADEYVPSVVPGIGFAPWMAPSAAAGKVYDASLAEVVGARDAFGAGLGIALALYEQGAAFAGLGASAGYTAGAREQGNAADAVGGGLWLAFGLDEVGVSTDVVGPLGAESPSEEVILAAAARFLWGGVRLSNMPRPMQRGQDAADELAQRAKDAAAKALRGDVAALRQWIESAAPQEHAIRAAILHAYGGMDPKALAEVARRVHILGELIGRLAAAEQARVAQPG